MVAQGGLRGEAERWGGSRVRAALEWARCSAGVPRGPIKGRAPGIAGYSWGRGSPAAAPEIADADVARAGIRRKGTGLNRGPGLAETQRRARVVRVKRAERGRAAGCGVWAACGAALAACVGLSGKRAGWAGACVEARRGTGPANWAERWAGVGFGFLLFYFFCFSKSNTTPTI